MRAAIALVVLAAGCATVDPAPPQPEGGMHITAEQVAKCHAGGGCVIASQETVMSLVQLAYDKGKADGAAEASDSCVSDTRRPRL